jgi:hypothetical protein
MKPRKLYKTYTKEFKQQANWCQRSNFINIRNNCSLSPISPDVLDPGMSYN